MVYRIELLDKTTIVPMGRIIKLMAIDKTDLNRQLEKYTKDFEIVEIKEWL